MSCIGRKNSLLCSAALLAVETQDLCQWMLKNACEAQFGCQWTAPHGKRLYDLDRASRAWCPCQPGVGGNERGLQRLRKSDIERVPRSQRALELPYSAQERPVPKT